MDPQPDTYCFYFCIPWCHLAPRFTVSVTRKYCAIMAGDTCQVASHPVQAIENGDNVHEVSTARGETAVTPHRPQSNDAQSNDETMAQLRDLTDRISQLEDEDPNKLETEVVALNEEHGACSD